MKEQVINFIWPPRCAVTGDEVETNGMLSPEGWAALQFISDPFCNCCGLPFEFKIEGVTLCGSCLAKRPKFEKARSALVYNDASRHVILGFKHGDQTHQVPSFMPWLKQAGKELLVKTDLIVPVPLHYWRLVKRRYNQAALIAKALAKETGIDYAPDILKRTRATPTQGFLNARERQKNVRNAFQVCVKKEEQVRGKNILLIDDVYTTGATVNECTKALLKAGAEEVNILALARVVKPNQIF